jgi:ubiquinone/menaquinone biosynthesis C-methylase UbiE
MNNENHQARFFDEQPSLYPWPKLLTAVGFGKTYKPRDLKFKKYLDRLEMKKGEKVLDVGCGEGVFLARLVKSYPVNAIGIDISKKSIRTASQIYSGKSQSLNFQVADALQLPFRDKSFSHVLSFDALEHIEDQKKALQEMIRVLKPKGRLLIYTINKNQRYTWNFCLKKLGVDIYKRVAHQQDLFLSPDWVTSELKKRGIKVEKLELFNSFFTLALDEIIMCFILLFSKLNLYNSSSPVKTDLGRAFLTLVNLLSRFSLPFLEFLELPWRNAGYSNSFFVLGKKK